MTCNIYFKNVTCENDKQYRIHTIWNDNSFTLTLIDDFKAYTADVSKNSIKDLAKKHGISFAIYVEELRTYLCTQVLDNIIYKRKNNSFLIFKKQDNISVQFADFKINEADFQQTTINVIDSMNTSSTFYQNEANNCKIKMDLAEEEKTIYMQKLKDFVNKKKDMEHELYSKFILILNEKKTRIQHLQEMLEKETLNKNKENKRKVDKEEISDSETSEDEPVKPIVHNVQIETAKKQINFLDNQEDGLKINLPKRAKIETKTTDAIENITKEEDPKNAIQNNEITASTEIVNNNSESQDGDFNTQDLIDMM